MLLFVMFFFKLLPVVCVVEATQNVYTHNDTNSLTILYHFKLTKSNAIWMLHISAHTCPHVK